MSKVVILQEIIVAEAGCSSTLRVMGTLEECVTGQGSPGSKIIYDLMLLEDFIRET